MEYLLSNDTWGEEEYKAIKNVLDSGRLTMGENVKAFEIAFAKKIGVKYAIMSNSGSSANLLGIAAMVYSGRLKKGDEVLVTAVSWSTTYFPLAQMGLKIRFVDINRETLNIDYDELEKAITPQSKAIFAVNLLGNPNDFEKLQIICSKYKLLLIEDNCESIGAEVNGKKSGSFGLFGSFSLYYSHHICSMEGGVTATNDKELYHYMLSIRSHGWTRHLPQDSEIYKKSSNPFYESFNFIMPGFNLRPLEIEAAAAIEQLKKLDIFIQQRRENATYFINCMRNKRNYQIQKVEGESSWFGFSIILINELMGKRQKYIENLIGHNIEVRPIVTGNFTRQKALDYLEYSISGQLQNADYIHDNGFFVGNHSIDMKEKIDYLVSVLDMTETICLADESN